MPEQIYTHYCRKNGNLCPKAIQSVGSPSVVVGISNVSHRLMCVNTLSPAGGDKLVGEGGSEQGHFMIQVREATAFVLRRVTHAWN